jgi:hypothetical protein
MAAGESQGMRFPGIVGAGTIDPGSATYPDRILVETAVDDPVRGG